MNRRIPFWRRFMFRPFEDGDGWMLSIALGFLWVNMRYQFPAMDYVYPPVASTDLYLGVIPWSITEGAVIPGFSVISLRNRMEEWIERL